MVSLRKISGFLVLLAILSVPASAEDDAETPVYEVDPETSRVFMYVHRAGLMRRAGHDHVIASEDVSGEVTYAPDRESFAELRLPLADLVVDAPGYRERFGLEPEVSESSIRGTRRNMLEKVLFVDEHPEVVVEVALVAHRELGTQVSAVVTLQGATAEYDVLCNVYTVADSLIADGKFTIRHTDFGMRPFRAAAGLLRVADEIDIHFEIVAELRTD